jgi:hypothetical protein
MFYFWGRGPTGNLLCSSSYSSFPYLLLLFFCFFPVYSFGVAESPLYCAILVVGFVLHKRREEKEREEKTREERFALGFALLVSSNWSALILRFENQHSAFFHLLAAKRKREAKGTHSVSVSVSVWKQPGVGVDDKVFCSVLFCFGLVWFL